MNIKDFLLSQKNLGDNQVIVCLLDHGETVCFSNINKMGGLCDDCKDIALTRNLISYCIYTFSAHHNLIGEQNTGTIKVNNDT